jgi:glutathione S-transferase
MTTSFEGNTPLLFVTIPQSHFCEKARWALQLAKIPFREDPHMPIFHLPATLLRGGKSTVPVLKTDRQTLSDSTDILHYIDTFLPDEKKLFPTQETLSKEVSRLEERFDLELGPAGRLWVYWHLLPDKSLSISILEDYVPSYQAKLGGLLFGLVRQMMYRKMKINEETATASLKTVQTIFDEVGALLSDGRKYLVGDRFTAADLCFASLGAVVVLPAEYGGPLPTLEATPPKMREVVKELRAHPAGQFILRLYEEHRPST